MDSQLKSYMAKADTTRIVLWPWRDERNLRALRHRPSDGWTSKRGPSRHRCILRTRPRPAERTLVWIETPANPMWTTTDIAVTCDIAHAAGAMVAVDSTVATPVLTRPLELGADIVMHAATKYLNGHSDVLAGTLTSRED